MKIAFVGKGGSGKTTLTALFTHYLKYNHPERPVLVIDADLNLHLAEALNIPKDHRPTALSEPNATKQLKQYIWNQNDRIKKIGEIKKTTPPTASSGFFWLTDPYNLLFQKYCVQNDLHYFAQVGTYQSEGIGRSCYHNNLAILENVLTHTISEDGCVVVDMVAGTDAFASSMHIQFDLLVFVIEPTVKSINVFSDYARLAKSAGIADKLVVIGNKILNDADERFLRSHLSEDQLLSILTFSDHLRAVERGETDFAFTKVEPVIHQAMDLVFLTLERKRSSYNDRLSHLQKLHQIYVEQDYVFDRFGDLTGQIDPDFDYNEFVAQNKHRYEQI